LSTEEGTDKAKTKQAKGKKDLEETLNKGFVVVGFPNNLEQCYY